MRAVSADVNKKLQRAKGGEGGGRGWAGTVESKVWGNNTWTQSWLYG